MTKPSITILVKPSGAIEVLAASHDAQDTLDAFLTCDKEGEVFHYRKVAYDKRKVNATSKAPAKKSAKK